MNQDPRKVLPKPWETVLLIHVFEDRDCEPLCESGYLDDDGALRWHNPIHEHDELEVHWWAPLPLMPAERPT
jgi:hypothetical protein